MKMSRLSILILLLIAVSGLYSAVVLAEEEAYQVIVNRATKECAVICSGDGDSCFACYPPPGWEHIGYENAVECPAGYTEVEVEPRIQTYTGVQCPTGGGGMEGWVGVTMDYILGAVLVIGLVVMALYKIRKFASDKS